MEYSFAHPGASNIPGYHSGNLILREEAYTRAPRGDVPWDLSYRPNLSPAKLLDLYAIMKNFAKGGMSATPTLRI